MPSSAILNAAQHLDLRNSKTCRDLQAHRNALAFSLNCIDYQIYIIFRLFRFFRPCLLILGPLISLWTARLSTSRRRVIKLNAKLIRYYISHLKTYLQYSMLIYNQLKHTLDMASPLLKATSKTIIPLLSTYKGTILPHITTLPPQYTKITNQTGEYLQRTYLFQNFKQAFSHFMLTTKTCQQYNYYPEIFNVYNKIVIKLSSSLDGHRKITSKDVYIGLLLNQINSNTVQNAHEVCLEKIKQII